MLRVLAITFVCPFYIDVFMWGDIVELLKLGDLILKEGVEYNRACLSQHDLLHNPI